MSVLRSTQSYRMAPQNSHHHFLFALTLSSVNRFSKLFHCQNQEKICNNTITKDLTTPQMWSYTTLWNVGCVTKQQLTTSCTNLVNLCAIISEFMHVKTRNFCRDSPANFTKIFIHLGVPKRIGISQFRFQWSNQQSFLYILYKFGEIRFSDPGV